MGSQATYPVVAHYLKVDPVAAHLGMIDKTGSNHQNLHVAVDLEDGPIKGVVQIQNVVEHLRDNKSLVDGSVHSRRRILSHVHQREETSVLHLLFAELGDIDHVVGPGGSADNTERDQDTLEFPETGG